MIGFAEKIKSAKFGQAHVFFAGQAGFVFKSGSGALVCIDLYVSDCVERLEGHIGFKRLIPTLADAKELVFDGVIATHPHYDHFDFDSMYALSENDKTHLFVSVGCNDLVRALGIDEKSVRYVKPGDSFCVKDVYVRCVPCDHGNAAPDAFGVVIGIDGKRIYIAGDTCLHTEYADEVLRDGKIDIMIAPINGAYGNLTEKECVALAARIKPGLTIPCHYGMFAAHGGDPWKFCQIMNAELPEQKYTLLTVGEQIDL